MRVKQDALISFLRCMRHAKHSFLECFKRVPYRVFTSNNMARQHLPPIPPHGTARHPHTPQGLKTVRRSAVDRIASTHLAAMGNTVADTVGHGARQRLVWLALLATPLLLPVALPGMASAVGVLCLLVAYGLSMGRNPDLPGWLGKRALGDRVKSLLAKMVQRSVGIMSHMGRPRMLALSNRPARLLNGLMLAIAGLSMAVPVPMISFDNVLPALAIVLMAWGLRLRDGLMLLAGYLATAVAVASVVALWWGGSVVVTDMLAWATG